MNVGCLWWSIPGRKGWHTKNGIPGADYTLEALKERIGAKSKQPVEKTGRSTVNGQKVDKLVDIKAKQQEGKGAGYEHTANFVRWTKLFNLKEAANTLNFLTEHGISDYDELVTRSDKAGEKFDAVSARIKQVESRLAELSELRSHIINYSKTRNIYTAYRNVKDKKAYLGAHRDGIAMHESAKQALLEPSEFIHKQTSRNDHYRFSRKSQFSSNEKAIAFIVKCPKLVYANASAKEIG